MARKKIKVYIAGPMTGYNNFNFDAFNEAAEELRSLGYLVVNPTESHDGDQTLTWETYLSWDLDQIRKVDGVVLLDGWQATTATGARLEIQYALAHSIPVVEYVDLLDFGLDGSPQVVEAYGFDSPRDFVKALNNGETFGWLDPRVDNTAPVRESILIKADSLVNGQRQQDYDHPTENFTRIVRLWNALLADKLSEDITPEEHALMMMMVKIARLQHSPDHEDSIVDIAGYAGTYEKLVERRKSVGIVQDFLSNLFASMALYEEDDEEALL